MTQGRTKRGRPAGSVGPVSIRVLDALSKRPMTAAQVAHELQLTIMAARYTCSRLEAAGAVRVCGYVRVAVAHRPVSVYELVPPPEPCALAAVWFDSSRVAGT